MTEINYSSKNEPVRSCLIALGEIILAFSPHIKETKKYGMPCFCFGQKPFCYLWTDKKNDNPYVLFVDGKLINHPLLEQGKEQK
jgi:hypothetical protein